MGFLVQLVALADQAQIATAGDAGADMADIGDFIAPGLLAAPAAFVLFVEQVVVAVLGRDQRQLFFCITC